MLKSLRLFLVGLCVAATVVPSQAALKVIFPQNNSVVRETVNVAVDANSVPRDSYLTFSLNGQFAVAVGEASEISGGRKAYTWVWDTREPVRLGAMNEQPKRPPDGPYDITIKAVDGGGRVADQVTLKVQLANKVTGIGETSPVKLAYQYRQGMRKRYAVRIAVSLEEAGGAPVTSNQEVQVFSYTSVETVEDIQPGPLALLRYNPVGGRIRVFGRPLGELQGFGAGSIYQLVDTAGGVMTSDLFSTVGVLTDQSFTADHRAVLPRAPVKAGDAWSGALGVSLPGFGRAFRGIARCTLGGLEWAGGKECAKIDVTMDGQTLVEVSAIGAGVESNAASAGPGPMPGGMFPSLQGSGATDSPVGSPAPVPGGGAEGLSSTAQAGAAPNTLVSAFSPLAASGTQSAGGMGPSGRVLAKGNLTGSDWFSLRLGELVRREMTLSLKMNWDQGSVERVMQGLGLDATAQTQSASGTGSSGGSDYSDPDSIIRDYSRATSAILGGLRGGSGSIPSLDSGTPVKLKVTVSARLLG